MSGKVKTKRKKKKLKPDKKALTLIVYFTLRILVILSLVVQGFHGNWNNVFLCIVTLFLFTLPDLLQEKLNITFPDTLETIVYLFIFSSAILGEIQNFYALPYWDTILHTLNGFLCAAVGFSLVDILNNNEELHIHLTPIFVSIVAICFSMTIGVLWEFVEYGADAYLNKDMQKDRIVKNISSVKINPNGLNEPITIEDINKTIIYSNNNTNMTVIEEGYLELGLIDTIKDLFVNFIGAIVFSLLGYLYIKNRDGYKFAEIFIPKLKKKAE